MPDASALTEIAKLEQKVLLLERWLVELETRIREPEESLPSTPTPPHAVSTPATAPPKIQEDRAGIPNQPKANRHNS